MSLPSSIDTVVVGAGQAGLAMSWFLQHAGREHVVLERRRTLGGGWQDRWDAFRLVTPNWAASFPGLPYDAPDADEFMPRDAIAARVAGYAAAIGAPVVTECAVERVTPRAGGGFLVTTNQGAVEANEVVIATGSFHRPRIPAVAEQLPGRIAHLHSHDYRNPGALPPGGVLIVGSGQSGLQIAEELWEAGRQVYLSVGSAGWCPRRYRGRDLFAWIAALASKGEQYGVPFPSVETLPDPRLRLVPNPQLSGHHGGHDVNLREFASRGMTLLGRIGRVDGERLELAPDLRANLARADGFFEERFRPRIDQFIERTGIAAPPDDHQPIEFEPPERADLDLAAAGISTVIWATGYGMEFGWIDGLTFDEQGFPRNRRGVGEIAGLYFLGLLWQHTQASATLVGPSLDAPHVVRHMGLPVPELTPFAIA